MYGVVAGAGYELMGARLGRSCELASFVDLAQDYGASVRMGVHWESSYGPANSAGQERECRCDATA